MAKDLVNLVEQVQGALPTGNGGSGSTTLSYPAGTDTLMGRASTDTVTGAKTFNAGTLLDKGQIVFDVKAFGAVGNGSTDDTAAIQAAIDAAHAAGGGDVLLTSHTYKTTAALKFYSGTTPTIVAYSNIRLRGLGASGTGGTVISQVTTSADIIKGINDVANAAQSTNCTIQDLCLSFGGATLTNSGNGIYLSQQSAGGPSYQQWTFKNVVIQNCQGSGKYALNIESIIASDANTVMAVSCANGFIINGQQGGAFDSVSTSINFNNCYANMAANAVNGFVVADDTYVNFHGCAVDVGGNMTGAAYLVEGGSVVNFFGCGYELDGTHTLAFGYKIAGDTAANPSSQIGIYGAYGYQGKSIVDVYVTGSSTGVFLQGFQDNSAISGGTGLKIDAGSSVTQVANSWGTVATPLTNAGTNMILDDGAGNQTVPGLSHQNGGTDTSGTAAATSPTFVTGTAKQCSTTQDCVLYVNIKTAATLAILLGPTSTPANTVLASETAALSVITIRVPKAWYVKITGTISDLGILQVTC